MDIDYNDQDFITSVEQTIKEKRINEAYRNLLQSMSIDRTRTINTPETKMTDLLRQLRI